ncbi:hypothetical protein ABZ897_01110 [Nonomuraea sp. NPDC046802]|uniref:hypothetical protein n=1 Tax=Nonomuraea sp. NPDC046802 TaxID=3154919 RepID=UPI0033F4FF2C
MAQPAPATVTVPVDQMRSIQRQAFDLSVQVSLVLEECGIDLTCPTASTSPTDAEVFSLDDFRARRQAAQR